MAFRHHLHTTANAFVCSEHALEGCRLPCAPTIGSLDNDAFQLSQMNCDWFPAIRKIWDSQRKRCKGKMMKRTLSIHILETVGCVCVCECVQLKYVFCFPSIAWMLLFSIEPIKNANAILDANSARSCYARWPKCSTALNCSCNMWETSMFESSNSLSLKSFAVYSFCVAANGSLVWSHVCSAHCLFEQSDDSKTNKEHAIQVYPIDECARLNGKCALSLLWVSERFFFRFA